MTRPAHTVHGLSRRRVLAAAAAGALGPGLAAAAQPSVAQPATLPMPAPHAPPAQPAPLAPLVAGERHSFVFTPSGYFADRPLTVEYYKAKSAGADAQVLIAVHGQERSATGARNPWIAFAEKNGLIVLAPEFDAKRFPPAMFSMGNLEERDPARWSIFLAEQLFDQVRESEHLTRPDYMLFGHSGGAQYVHRMMLLTPSPRVSIAIAANSGSYTLPMYPGPMSDPFPWTLEPKIVPPAMLRRVFARKLVLLLGEADVDPDSPSLPRQPQAMFQGINRWERGHRFFASAQVQARKLDTPLAWQLVPVAGVGHDVQGMSRAAGQLLFGAARPLLHDGPRAPAR